VRNVRLLPAGAPACALSVDAVRDADVVILGPGSWFTSVIPHLLLKELGDAIAHAHGIVIVTVNLVPQAGETDGFSAEELLKALAQHSPELRIDAVIADDTSVDDPAALRAYTASIGSELVLAKVSKSDNHAEHEPLLLADAYRRAIEAVTSRRASLSPTAQL
jgi:uncharacterized cofD-like protein